MSSKSRLNVEFARSEVGFRQAADGALQSELDISQVGSGLEVDGTYEPNLSSNYIDEASSLKDADNKLDVQIKTVATDLANLGSGSLTDLQNEVNTMETGAGLEDDGTYVAPASNYISLANDLKDADVLLDAQVKLNETAISTEAGARVTAVGEVQDELDLTQTGAGLLATGAYSADAGAPYIGTATSIHNATQRLSSALDTEVTNRGIAELAIQGEIDDTQTGAGLNGDGTYSPDLATDYIDEASSLKNADSLLDAQIAQVASDLSDLGSGSLTDIQNEVNLIETGAGLDTDGTYIVNTGGTYIGTANDLADADDKLDVAVAANATAIGNEITDRGTAVGNEANARIAQDNVIEAGAGLEIDGTYLANNTTTNYLGTASSLKDADEKLDVQVKANETAISTETSDRVTAVGNNTTAIGNEVSRATGIEGNLQTEIDAIENSTGLETDGTYVQHTTSNYIDGALDLKAVDVLLDAQVHTNAGDISDLQGLVSGSTGDIQDELDLTQAGAGLAADGTYTHETSSNYIDGANSLANADHVLDAAIKTENTRATGIEGNIQAELDDTQTGAGLAADGAYVADVGNYMGSSTSLADALHDLDAQIKVNELYDGTQDGVIASKLPKAGGTMSGVINTDGNIITGLPAPTNATDATNKAYVDGNLAGLSWKNSVVAASGSNIDLDGLETIDDISVVADDRVLVMGQTAASENGIYVVAAGAWSRSEDFDSLTPIDEVNGAAVYVEQGTTYGDNGYTVTSVVTTLDTDQVIFTQFNGASAITAGTGLAKTGNTLDINLGAGIGELPSDEIGVEVYSAGGLFNTVDGSTESADTAAQLAVKVDGTTITRAAAGIKVSDATITSISTNATAIGTEVSRATGIEGNIQTELDDTQTGAGLAANGDYVADGSSTYLKLATSTLNATSLLDDQVKINEDAIDALVISAAGDVSDLQDELDDTQTGAGLAADGTYTANAATNYMKTSSDIIDATEDLDAQLLATTTTADAAEPDLGVGIGEDYVLMTAMNGTRSWVPFNQTQVGRIDETFTAADGQSVITVNYAPALVDVWLNGFKLIKGTDFTASNGTSITISPALSAGDIVEVTSYEQYVYSAVPQIDSNGDLTINGDIHADAYYTDSLRSLKTNIVASEISAVDMINDTEIVEFNYKTALQGDTRIGFIADDTDPMMSSSSQNQFDMANTIGVLLKAVQELSAEIADLKEQLEE